MELPFASKIFNHHKLFRRKIGSLKSIAPGESGAIDLAVPFTKCKINEIEILGAACGDVSSLYVLDSSGQQLNQFGFDVVVGEGFYRDKSDYDADLYQGMIIRVLIKNNSATTRTYGANFTLHEMVAIYE